MQKKKQGISLIVLVITIIVMIILAATIIISLSNNGVINNAKDAVDKTNEKQVQEIANLAWGEAYADGKREVSDLQSAVENALKANNLNPEDYSIQVTEKGVTIKDMNSVWIQKADRTVVKGDTVLNIGSDISYDETNGGTETGLTDVDWKVLGAENGELLIMSTTDITSKTFNSENTVEGGRQAYVNGISELNALCTPYGKGAYALGARSITAEDVDRVTGYDKTTYESDINGCGNIKYGESITYYWNNTTNSPCWEISSGISGTINSSGTPFTYYNGKEWVTSTRPSSLTDKQEICTLTQTAYTYFPARDGYLVKETDAYSMLFGNDDVKYWLATTSVNNYTYGSYYGLFATGFSSYGESYLSRAYLADHPGWNDYRKYY